MIISAFIYPVALFFLNKALSLLFARGFLFSGCFHKKGFYLFKLA